MSPQFDSPDLPNSLDAHSLRRVSWLRRLVFLAVPLLGMAVALPAPGQELRFSTENDVFSGDDAEDDLYTFAVALEMERGPYTLSLRENAFTDRAAGARFDETYLSIGRALPGLGAWQVYAEAGAVHVGHGLFGEGVQNAVHRLLDQEEVELTYRGASLHPRLAVIAERPFAVAGGLDVLALGPRFEVDSVPGLRSLALAGAQVRWQPRSGLAVQLLAGGRYAHSSFAPLEPHLIELAAVVRVGLVVKDRISLSWSYNDAGDRREHLSVGYRLSVGRLGPAVDP